MEKMREEFEKAVVDGVIIGHLFGHEFAKSIRKTQVSDCFTCGKYQNDVLQLSWEVWQASRAALRVKLPSFDNGSLRGYGGDCEEARAVVDSVAESLEEAGVRYE